ncbi:uncharacterized protein LOC131215300 [Anopheles bellator]|uniref:uncharacterized protein LOC131215300 n=1 Tax=Anopheles bellator TaxID=139047 RepID=UPI0026488F6F|nr:uncharacterized protein LOC131215300 [Anopheles bellator]
MADKRDKIAAARKKLKQYQARQKDRDGEPCNEPTPPDIDLAAQTAPSSSSASSTTELPVTVPLPVEPVPDSHWERDSNGPTNDGAARISNYFTTNKSTGTFPVFNSPQSGLGMDIFGSIEPQIAPVPGPSQRQPDPPAPAPAPVFDASVYSINKISDEIGNLIANANADLGPQNTILELESEKADLARQLNAEKLENEELRLRLRNNQSSTVHDI